jgi:hypothetical protein
VWQEAQLLPSDPIDRVELRHRLIDEDHRRVVEIVHLHGLGLVGRNTQPE